MGSEHNRIESSDRQRKSAVLSIFVHSRNTHTLGPIDPDAGPVFEIPMADEFRAIKGILIGLVIVLPFWAGVAYLVLHYWGNK